MVSATQRQAVLIGKRGEIVRVRRIHYKTNQRAALFLWPKDASSRQFRQALGCIPRQLRVVLKNRWPPDLLDVINRCREPDRTSDIWRAGLEPVRRFLKRAFFEGNAHNHFTAAMP